MEDNFEKKGSKKFLKIVLPLILIAALIAVSVYFFLNKTNAKPVNVFKGAVEKAFAKVEVKEDSKTGKAKFEITASIDSDDVNVRAINEYIKTAKITLNEEVDINKQLMKYNALVNYNNDKLIDADIILQNGKIYAFAEDFFSKYVELDADEMDMEEVTEMLEEVFKTAKNVSKTETNKLLKDVEKTILEFLDEQEYESEKLETKIGGETVKTTKATLKLNEKQLAKLFKKVLTILKDSDYLMSIVPSSDIDLKDKIEDLIEELDDVDTSDMVIKISLYTTGVTGEIAKAEITAKEDDEEIFTVSFEKTNKEKSIVSIAAEGESIKVEINEKDKNTTTYSLVLPEEFEGTKIELEHTKSGKNEGKLVLTAKASGDMLASYGIKDDVTIKLNISYKFDYNVNVEETNVTNSIKMDEFTQEDQQELMTKFQNSKLYSLISTFIGQ